MSIENAATAIFLDSSFNRERRSSDLSAITTLKSEKTIEDYSFLEAESVSTNKREFRVSIPILFLENYA